jgi:hypothetical protein
MRSTKRRQRPRRVGASIKKSSPRGGKARAGRSTGTKVMGVRVPKSLTDALDALINSPRGREILAGAIVAAASAAAAALMKRSDRRQVAKAREAAAEAGSQVTKDLSDVAAGVVADIVTSSARTLLPASFTRESSKKTRD